MLLPRKQTLKPKQIWCHLQLLQNHYGRLQNHLVKWHLQKWWLHSEKGVTTKKETSRWWVPPGQNPVVYSPILTMERMFHQHPWNLFDLQRHLHKQVLVVYLQLWVEVPASLLNVQHWTTVSVLFLCRSYFRQIEYEPGNSFASTPFHYFNKKNALGYLPFPPIFRGRCFDNYTDRWFSIDQSRSFVNSHGQFTTQFILSWTMAFICILGLLSELLQSFLLAFFR